MNKDQLKAILEKIPWTPLLGVYLLYLGYDFYSFKNDDSSPWRAKLAEATSANSEVEKIETRVKSLRKFKQEVDVKRAQIQQRALELEAMKVRIPERIDRYEVDSAITTEAAKSRLVVTARKWEDPVQRELYAEQGIKLKIQGVFQQIMTFLDRISNVQRLMSVQGLEIKPKGSAKARFVIVEGELELKVYRYSGSKADEVGKKGNGAAVPKKAGG